MGWEGASLASKTEKRDRGKCGEKAEVMCRTVQIVTLYVCAVKVEVGNQAGSGGESWFGVAWRMRCRHKSERCGGERGEEGGIGGQDSGGGSAGGQERLQPEDRGGGILGRCRGRELL